MDKISRLKLALDARNKETNDLKSQNKLLSEEINGMKVKMNETKQVMKNQIPELSTSNLQKLPEQYRNLLRAYEDLVQTNAQMKETLKNEALQKEEQRVRIKALEEHTEYVLDISQILPYFKINHNNSKGTLTMNRFKSHKGSLDTQKTHEISKNVADNYIDFVSMHKYIQNFKNIENELRKEIIELKQGRDKEEHHQNDSELVAANEKLNEDIMKFIRSITLLQEENLKLNKEKDSLLDFIDKRLAGSENAKKKTEELLMEKESMMEMLREREIDINDKIIENQQMGEKFKTLTTELERNKENLATLSVTLSVTQADLERLNQKYEELEKNKNSLEIDNQTRRLEQEKQCEHNIEKESLMNELNERMVIYERNIDMKQNLINDLTSKNYKLESDLNTVNTCLQETRNEISKYTMEISELKLDITTVRVTNERFKIDINDLHSDIERKRKSISDLIRKLGDKEKAYSSNKSDGKLKSPNKKDRILEENYDIIGNLQNNLGFKEDNNKLQEKIILLNRKIMEITENESKLMNQNVQLRNDYNVVKEYLNDLKHYLKKNSELFYHTSEYKKDDDYSIYGDASGALPLKIDDVELLYKDIVRYLETNIIDIDKYNKIISDLKSESNSNNNRLDVDVIMEVKKDKILLEKAKEALNERVEHLEYENKIINDELANLKLTHFSVIFPFISYLIYY